MKAESTKPQIPREAKTFDQICDLPRVHVDSGDWHFMVDDGKIWISERALGEMPKQRIAIPRGLFNRFIDWYNGAKTRKAAK